MARAGHSLIDAETSIASPSSRQHGSAQAQQHQHPGLWLEHRCRHITGAQRHGQPEGVLGGMLWLAWPALNIHACCESGAYSKPTQERDMDLISKPGGSKNSVTPSTRLLNQKLGTSPELRMLTPSEIALLRQSKQEIAQRVAEIASSRKG